VTLSPAARVRRGQLRRGIAVLVVVCWVAALGGLVRRDVLRTPTQRLAELALRVNPGNIFYAVERDGRHVGYASSSIDTMPDTSAVYLVIRDEIVYDLRLGDSLHRARMVTEFVLTRGFTLLSFQTEGDFGTGPVRRVGWTENDSTVAYYDEIAGIVPDTQRRTTEPLAMVPSLVPLASILDNTPRAGRRSLYRSVGNEWQGVDRRTEIRAESLFVVDDSARMNAGSGRWVSALRDTVRAWRVVTDDDPPFDGWLDAQGRIVETTHRLGVTMRRMAFELAFENWRLSTATSPR
jgi:hypothetical protein